MLDELQLTVTGAADLSPPRIDAIRRTLLSRRVMTELTHAIRAVFERQAALEPLKVRVSR